MQANSSIADAPVVHCEATAGPGAGVRYEIENVTAHTIHIFDDDRMPYLIAEGPKKLLVLVGVTAPPDDVDFSFVHIPLTRPLEPGARGGGEVSLSPPVFHDHYGPKPPPAGLEGEVEVRCSVAWGTTPIDRTNRHLQSVNLLLKWQTLATSAPVRVTL